MNIQLTIPRKMELTTQAGTAQSVWLNYARPPLWSVFNNWVWRRLPGVYHWRKHWSLWCLVGTTETPASPPLDTDGMKLHLIAKDYPQSWKDKFQEVVNADRH